MKIGIDISQTMYGNTGVGEYLLNLICSIVTSNTKNKYILFFSSFRRRVPKEVLRLESQTVTIKTFPFPSVFLHIIWNIFHIIPIEKFIGDIDVFITSDWTEPPAKRAKKATIIYDLVVYKFPKETDRKIVSVQRKKLQWVKKESDVIFCISESTKKDVAEVLGVDKKRLTVLYPGR